MSVRNVLVGLRKMNYELAIKKYGFAHEFNKLSELP